MARRDAPGPYNLDDLRALPAPSLFERDPAILRRMLIEWFEQETKRTLYPMQVEMLLIDMLAYAWSLTNTDGQFAHMQRYVALADSTWLEQLGAMPGIETPRLTASSAVARLRFTLSAPLAYGAIIPRGTRIGAGAAIFATNAPLTIAAGATQGEVLATAMHPGADANGLPAGAIASLLDPIAGIGSVANVEASAGGADAELIESYRLRLANALEKASICGQRMGYVEHTLAISADIIDCAAVRPQPCYIDLYPLTAQGPVMGALAETIKARLDDLQENEILPMGDLATVKQAEAVPFSIHMQIVANSGDPGVPAAAARAIVEPWRLMLGAVVAPEAVRAAVKAVSGIVNVETPGFSYRALEPHQYAVIDIFPPNVSLVGGAA